MNVHTLIMIIGIDSRFAIKAKRGIGNYCLNLIANIAAIDNINQYILYVDQRDDDEVLPKQDNFLVKVLKPSIYPIWEQVSLPVQATRDKVDLLHCTGNTFPIWGRRQFKTVATIHDVMFLKEEFSSGSLYQFIGNKYRGLVVNRFSHTLDSIITVSKFSKQDILDTVKHLNPECIYCTYESYDPLFDSLGNSTARAIVEKELGIRCPYILALGATEPRKNTRSIIKVFANLRKYKTNINYKLVITGIPERSHRIFQDSINFLGLQGDVILTDFISTRALVALYRCSTIFLYPSLYEGFGIPLLEAMASSTPIITSNITSMPEILGEAGVLVNPTDLMQLERALIKLLNDQSLRQELINKGLKRVKEFSWRSVAMKTLEVYNNFPELVD